MSQLTRKFIAVLLLLWLPVFNGSALAATVPMQMAPGGCHETSEAQTMPGMDMGEHHQHHGDAPANEHACGSCSVCHLVCTGYLSVPAIEFAAVQNHVREFTPYLVSFQSFTSAPLVPPPLVRA